MSAVYTFALAALPLLTSVAVSGTLLAVESNDTVRLLGLKSPTDPKLFVRFFTPILDSRNISLSVQGIHFLGQWMSAWVLILVESFRMAPGNHSTHIARQYVVVFGVLMELLGVGNVMPVWALVNLVQDYSGATKLDQISASDAVVLPWSLLIGVGLPTVLMQLMPNKSALPILSKPFWILVRLAHPLLLIAVHRLLVPRWAADHVSQDASTSAVRFLYTIAFWMSALPHVLTLSLMLAAALAPDAFSPATARSLTPSAIWPASSPRPTGRSKVKTVQEGIGRFLFWDEVSTGLAVFIWAVVVNQAADTADKSRSLAFTVGRAGFLALLAGPSAAAMLLLREARG